MENNPSISVMMPTYNNGKYIKQAIDSIYAQEYDNIEIIVVDDGSTDNTKEILKQYKDIKYIYTEHKGISFARNVALEHSKGEYMAFCDSDDYWLPNKLNTQIKYFKEHPDCEIVFTKYKNIFESEQLKKIERVIHEQELEKTEKRHLPSALMKKSLFNKYGNFDEGFKTGEDFEFVYRLRHDELNVSHYINKVLYIRRIHGNNITLTINQEYIKLVIDILRKKRVLQR